MAASTNEDMPADFVCLSHVNDVTLGARLRGWVDAKTACDLCGATGAVDFSLVTEIVHGALGARFKPAQEWNAPWDEIESGDETRLYDLGELLDGELALFDAVDDGLYGEIEASFGADTMWVTAFEHDMRPRDKDVRGWSEFRELVEHKSRYLQLDEQSLLSQIYGVPSPREMLERVARLMDHHNMYRTLRPGMLLWRGRVHDRQAPSWGARELASAPPRLARQSRMSAAGISLFYGALDVDTVAAELAVDTRPWLMVGAFTPTRPLRAIDLTRLPEFLSPFAEDGARHEDDLLFLRAFADNVSRPVVDPELVHIDYAPTQVVSEYLRYAFIPGGRRQPVDGLVYRSSRHDGDCVAVFADQDQCLGTASENRQERPAKLLRWAGRACRVRPHPPNPRRSP